MPGFLISMAFSVIVAMMFKSEETCSCHLSCDPSSMGVDFREDMSKTIYT